MKKRVKSAVLLASVLAFVSLFSGFDTLPAVEALPEGARILLENGIPLSVVQETMNQEAALEAYDTLYANMGIDSIDVSTSETGYPDEYAGEYIDDNGMLVIQLAEYDETLEEKYYAMTGYSDVVRFEYVEYSYNELNEVYQEARQLYADYDIVKSYIDTYNNQIALFVTAEDYNSLLSDEFIQLNDEYIRIEVGEEGIAMASLYGGSEIVGSTPDEYGRLPHSTVCIGGTYAGNPAILSCGHGIYDGDTITYNGHEIGEAAYSQANTDDFFCAQQASISFGDYSIIELTDNSYNTTNEVINGVEIKGLRTNIPIGTITYKYGYVTGLSSSTVTAKDVTYEYTADDTNMRDIYYVNGLIECRLNSLHSCTGGDSGGPVYSYSTSNTTALLSGLVSASTKDGRYMYATSIVYPRNYGFSVKTS